MIPNIAKWIGKTVTAFVIWVFVLSINYEEKTLFTHANEFLVQNEIVQSIDRELTDLWYDISEKTRITFSMPKEGRDEG